MSYFSNAACDLTMIFCNNCVFGATLLTDMHSYKH